MDDKDLEINTGCQDEEELDPRVQIELEKLNVATDEINRLEATLEEATNSFRANLADTSTQLQALSKKLGNSIDKARPYYETIERVKQLQSDCQRAAAQFQRANSVHQAAKETIALAEEKFSNIRNDLNRSREFNSAWQEMLNHATMKIMEAEAQKSASERQHSQIATAYTAAEREAQDLYRNFKSAINKSRPYFNHRASTEVQLQAQKDRIHELQREIYFAKSRYSNSLKNLEQISKEIHEHRRAHMKREPGVGAEMDPEEEFGSGSNSTEELKTKEDHKYWKDLRLKLDEMDKDTKENQGTTEVNFTESIHITSAINIDGSSKCEDICSNSEESCNDSCTKSTVESDLTRMSVLEKENKFNKDKVVTS